MEQEGNKLVMNLKGDDMWLEWLHGGYYKLVKDGVIMPALDVELELDEIDPHLDESYLVKWLKFYNLFDDKVKKALEWARRVHGEQKRDDGAPYLEQHVYPVVGSLIWMRHLKRDELLKSKELNEKEFVFVSEYGRKVHKWMISAALLHDVLEDGEINEEDMKREFGDLIYDTVKTLTKGRPWEEEWDIENYKKRIKSASPEIRVIKLADRLNNLMCLKYALEEKRKRYIKETREFYLPLARKTSNYWYTWMLRVLKSLERAEVINIGLDN